MTNLVHAFSNEKGRIDLRVWRRSLVPEGTEARMVVAFLRGIHAWLSDEEKQFVLPLEVEGVSIYQSKWSTLLHSLSLVKRANWDPEVVGGPSRIWDVHNVMVTCGVGDAHTPCNPLLLMDTVTVNYMHAHGHTHVYREIYMGKRRPFQRGNLCWLTIMSHGKQINLDFTMPSMFDVLATTNCVQLRDM